MIRIGSLPMVFVPFLLPAAAPVAISKYLRQIAFLPGRSRKLLQSQRRKSVRNCDS